jgi:uncharacterized protein (TIGR03067 family)
LELWTFWNLEPEPNMRALFAFALVAAIGGTALADDKEALKALEGNYLLVGLETKGIKVGADALKKEDAAERAVVVKGDQMIAKLKGKDNKLIDDPATIKLDTSKTPAHIDLTSMKDGKPEVNYGIYKFEKDVLTICALEKGDAKDRPSKFEAGDKYLILVFEKQPAKK